VPVSMASSNGQGIGTYHFRKVVRVTRLETRSASVIGQGQLWNSEYEQDHRCTWTV